VLRFQSSIPCFLFKKLSLLRVLLFLLILLIPFVSPPFFSRFFLHDSPSITSYQNTRPHSSHLDNSPLLLSFSHCVIPPLSSSHILSVSSPSAIDRELCPTPDLTVYDCARDSGIHVSPVGRCKRE
jgi:hypothetical protein